MFLWSHVAPPWFCAWRLLVGGRPRSPHYQAEVSQRYEEQAHDDYEHEEAQQEVGDFAGRGDQGERHTHKEDQRYYAGDGEPRLGSVVRVPETMVGERHRG